LNGKRVKRSASRTDHNRGDGQRDILDPPQVVPVGSQKFLSYSNQQIAIPDDRACRRGVAGQIRTDADAEYLCSKIVELRATDRSKVVADFSELSFLDSTGIGFLVGIYTSTVNRNDGCFILSNPGPRVRHVLKVTTLAEILPVGADEASAIEMVNRPHRAVSTRSDFLSKLLGYRVMPPRPKYTLKIPKRVVECAGDFPVRNRLSQPC
jgi:anti-sigma B factor antagonist